MWLMTGSMCVNLDNVLFVCESIGSVPGVQFHLVSGRKVQVDFNGPDGEGEARAYFEELIAKVGAIETSAHDSTTIYLDATMHQGTPPSGPARRADA